MSNDLCQQLKQWHSRLEPVLTTLHKLAGSTEDQFLKLGERLQDFAFRSSSISATARDLVDLVAGDESGNLTTQLRQLFCDMETYLAAIQQQSNTGCQTLQQVLNQLDTVVQPLEGFQKMDKALRMLSISTKIESARIGELGSGFTTLAMDVEKLSHTVSEKSAGIMEQRLALTSLISNNLERVRASGTTQYADASRIMTELANGIQTIETLNQSCSTAGQLAEETAGEVSAEIGAVVSSMQFHDITRQQVEHVIEALEKLLQHSCKQPHAIPDETCPALVSETGDVCELQTAQTHHAADQLAKATVAIMDSLQSIAQKQSQVSHELQTILTGGASSSDANLLMVMQQNMHDVLAILNRCAAADKILSEAMQEVGTTITQIGGFVHDIETVGSEIDLIALNAQIKAAHTGPEGAALGVLAEAIKRLSLDAVVQTEAVSATLRAIDSITVDIQHEASDDLQSLQQVVKMEQDAGQIINNLGHITTGLHDRLAALTGTASDLADEISALIAGVHVHEETVQLAKEAEDVLEQIYREARAIVPASNEFRENLRHMEQRYTMESERLIHEMLAARHGVSLQLHKQETAAAGSGSEYGDNVDLF